MSRTRLASVFFGFVFVFSGCKQLDFNSQPQFFLDGSGLGDNETQNIAPVPVPPAGIVQMDYNYSIQFEVRAIDPDHTPDELYFQITDFPSNGSALLNAAAPGEFPTITYTPNPGYFGPDLLRFKVTDSAGEESQSTARVDLAVTPTGDRRTMGTFELGACIPFTAPFEINQVADETTYTFNATAFSADCTNAIYQQSESGTYTMGMDVISPTGDFVSETDFVRTTFFITPLGAANAAALNAGNFCGFNDWAAGVAKDLAPTGCNGIHGAGETQFGVNQTVFNSTTGEVTLALVDINAGGDGLTEATRWMDVNRTWELIRIAP